MFKIVYLYFVRLDIFSIMQRLLHKQNVASLSLTYRYFYGKCSHEPLPFPIDILEDRHSLLFQGYFEQINSFIVLHLMQAQGFDILIQQPSSDLQC